MLVRKCDICGAEIVKYNRRFELAYKDDIREVKYDVCDNCIRRIWSEINENDEQTERGE